jgi:hypothetical protein
MAAEMGCPTHTHNNATGEKEGLDGSVQIPPRRHFHPRDKTLQFLAYEEFSGRREGFVFRLGGQGVGYYEDRPWTVEDLEEETHEQEKKQDGI